MSAKGTGKLKDLTYNILYQLHYIENVSLTMIAKIYNVTSAAVIQHAKKLSFIARDSATATKLAITGENNPAKRPEVRALLTGPNNHFYGKTHTEENRKIISEKNILHHQTHGHPQLGIVREEWRGELNVMKRSDVKDKHKKIMSEKFSGENCSFWKGGITPLNTAVRQLSEYHTWRTCCFIRDKRTCQCCGEIKGELHVDHIVPFCFILMKNNIKSIQEAKDCKELFDISNGRVLCFKCHKKTDTYGHKANEYAE